MDAQLLKGFIEEAAAYLPGIRASFEAFSANPSKIAGLADSQTQFHTIKGAAGMMGLVEIARLSAEISEDLKTIIADPALHERTGAQGLLAKLLNLETILLTAAENIGEISETDFDPNSFLDEEGLFDDLVAHENDETKESEFDFEDFEIDEDMLEIFAMEAEDHLRNISANLMLSEENPDNREALLEIRRSSHTLKGSAGIVGFKKLSAMAHRVEDLLDYISEHQVPGNESIFELLLSSTDCLERLTRGKDSADLDRKIEDLYERFDKMLESFQTLLVLPEAAEAIIGTSRETDIPHEIANVLEIEEAREHENLAPDPQSRSVIRVSLERLDDLVKLVSEMVISRSVFEQKLVEFEQQIQELQHINHRLRNSSGTLEMDFGTNISGSRAITLPSFGFGAKTLPAPFLKELDEFDELEFDRYTDFQQATRELAETAGDTSSIHGELEGLYRNLGSVFDTQRGLIEEMQTSLLRLRMVPLSSLTARLQRTVRVTAAEEGKQVDLRIENESIEVDTEILDSFVEPLIHILRNGVAHGIEPAETRTLLGKSEKGTITLSAHSEGTHIVFVISDDGRGISIPAIKKKALELGFINRKDANTMTDERVFSLIFLPGLSTATAVDEISGRGVGMNIVKANIARRQGTISIKSEPQKGTSFTVRLPMSLAVTRSLLVKADDQTYALPQKLVKQVIEISPDELTRIVAAEVFEYDGRSYKYFHFNDLLNLPTVENPINTRIPLLLLETSESPCAMVVEQLIKPQEIVIKPLGSLYANIPEIIGATILGDGSVVPVLDLVYLIKNVPARKKSANVKIPKARSTINILVVDDSPSVRQINSNLIQNSGWQATVAKDGLEALDMLQSARSLPDIILTDVEMPRMDGYELLAALKRNENLRSIPVIMVTSRSGEKHRRKAFDLGASEYLTKPFQEAALIETIKNLSAL